MSRPMFLPDRLRPALPRRRPRRLLALVAAIPGCLLLLPLWRVQTVDVTGCGELPVSLERSLRQLEGTSLLTLDLDRVREQVEAWPGVASVEVRLELPGTLHVTVRQATARASVPVGAGWHGVDDAGRLTGALAQPLPLSLERFPPSPEELRQGLAVADRIGRACLARVRTVRRITPSDFAVALERAGTELVIHVRPQPTVGERLWCEHAASGQLAWRWADLRWDSRLVLGRAEPGPEPPQAAPTEPGGRL